jgi:ABC-type branched-subunit amino acid transport system substrate-binding protein
MNPSENDSEPNSQIQQDLKGSQNQVIGQVLGGMVVYGQVIYNNPPAESDSSMAKTESAQIGANPYKGLLAFHETDGDRFFGRDPQIRELWEKFRRLHEDESAIRLLTIYGPSGSGKSSLARAGLVPALAKRPLLGCNRARVAVLVPGSHPLEALATVLARVATEDATPVAKTREFVAELKAANSEGVYDGLRRIADALPEIASKPLIVLVDQLEEMFTLCEDATEREAFLRNLLCATGERSKRVSAIVTIRSDFLGATQQHRYLNELIASQGFFVAAMSPEGLREAITKPAEKAGHALDASTVDRLIEQTEGREGALPLLQFALTRIWEGVVERKEAAETLREIGGVGGALAGEAQRIYDRLPSEAQEIARRIFLGLVQLGEGTKDTRRRTELERVVSHRDSLEQVQKVIGRFSAPGVRLITLAENGGTQTAEVTHEALFEHWQQMKVWLDGSRSDLRFQRRLDEAAKIWQENGKPDGSLWRSPDLNLLREFYNRLGDDMTPVQVMFFEASANLEQSKQLAVKKAEKDRKRQRKFVIWMLSIGLLTTSGVSLFAVRQVQQVYRQQKEKDDLYKDYAYCTVEKGRPGKKVGKTCFRDLMTSGEVSVSLVGSNFHLNEGIEAFKNKDYEKSIKLFQAAIDGDITDPVPRIFLQNSLARQHSKALNLKPLKLAAVVSVDYYGAAATDILKGVADAQEKFNQKRRDTQAPLMEIVIANDENEPEAAQEIAKKLIEDSSILGIVGHHASESTIAAQKIYETKRISLISPTSSSSNIKGNQFFRTVGSTKKASEKYIGYMRKILNIDKISIFYNEKSEYSRNLTKNLNILFSQSLTGEKAMKVVDMSINFFNLEKEILSKPETKAALIISDVRTNSIAIAINKNNARNRKIQLFGAMSLSEDETLKNGGKYVEGMILMRPCLSSQSIYMKETAKRWNQQDTNWRTATSYDATQAFAKAISLSKSVTRESILRQLQSPTFFLTKEETSGFGLKWDLSDRSNSKREYCAVQIKDGRFIEL